MEINEPIMRRGLCAEGRNIREKHQGSLLNDEFGVTSIPIQKKIEKDHLQENVLRLKEIQAKCRVQEVKLASGCQPIKAVRPKISNLPLDQMDCSEHEDVIYSSVRPKDENSHSDYFSLSDQALNESIRDSIRSDPDLHKTCLSVNSQKLTVPEISKSYLNENVPGQDSNYSKFYKSVRNQENVPYEDFHNQKYPHAITENRTPGNELSNYFNAIKQKQINGIIDIIRRRMPACESDVNHIWKHIERQHRALFPDELCTFRSNSRVGSSKALSSQRGSAGLSRSQSLERFQRKPQTNSLSVDDLTSKLTLESRSSSTKDLNLSQHSTNPNCFNTFQSKLNPCQSVSLPFLPNQEYPKRNEMYLDDKTIPVIDRSKMANDKSHLPYAEIPYPLPLRPLNNDMVNANKRGIYVEESCRHIGSQVNEQDLKASSLGVGRKNAYSQTVAQPILSKQPNSRTLKSKLSNNIRLPGQPPPTYKRGQLPKYLKARKAETRRNQEAAASIDPDCPPNHMLLPDHERRNTLHHLKKGQADVMRQLSTLPLVQDTERVKKLRRELEIKLSQLEEGIQMFSQPKVFIANEEHV